jgi:hypothetical protein
LVHDPQETFLVHIHTDKYPSDEYVKKETFGILTWGRDATITIFGIITNTSSQGSNLENHIVAIQAPGEGYQSKLLTDKNGKFEWSVPIQGEGRVQIVAQIKDQDWTEDMVSPEVTRERSTPTAWFAGSIGAAIILLGLLAIPALTIELPGKATTKIPTKSAVKVPPEGGKNRKGIVQALFIGAAFVLCIFAAILLYNFPLAPNGPDNGTIATTFVFPIVTGIVTAFIVPLLKQRSRR